MRTRTERRRQRSGATATETALALTVCLLFLFAVCEYGRALMLRHLVNNAVREGARLAVVSTQTRTTADIQGAVTQSLAGQPLTDVTIDVFAADPATGANVGPWNDAALGQGIGVQVSGRYAPLFPSFGLLPASVSVTAGVIMRSEAN